MPLYRISEFADTNGRRKELPAGLVAQAIVSFLELALALLRLHLAETGQEDSGEDNPMSYFETRVLNARATAAGCLLAESAFQKDQGARTKSRTTGGGGP